MYYPLSPVVRHIVVDIGEYNPCPRFFGYLTNDYSSKQVST